MGLRLALALLLAGVPAALAGGPPAKPGVADEVVRVAAAAPLALERAGVATQGESLQVLRVPLRTSAVAYDAATQRLYASIPGAAGPHGNSVVWIDPATGAVGPLLFAGSEPGPLAPAGDGRTLYVGLAGGSAVQRIDSATWSRGASFPLDAPVPPTEAELRGPHVPRVLLPLPGEGERIVVMDHRRVALYDAGVLRPQTVPVNPGALLLADPETGGIYVCTSAAVRKLAVDDLGVTLTGPSVRTRSGCDANTGTHVRGGVLYQGGAAVDVETGAPLGRFSGEGRDTVVLPAIRRRVSVAQTGSCSAPSDQLRLHVHDLDRFVFLGSVPLGVCAVAHGMDAWGEDGVAVRLEREVLLLRLPRDVSSVQGPEPFAPTPAAPLIEPGDPLAVRRLELGVPLTDLVHDAPRGRAYGAVPGTAGPAGNSVVWVDSATGTVGPPLFVGSDPAQLALSDDGRSLYVWLSGAASVRRVDTATWEVGPAFSLSSGPPASVSPSAVVVAEMRVLPGTTDSLVISWREVSGAAQTAVFDSGVPRPRREAGMFAVAFTDPRHMVGCALAGPYAGALHLAVDDSGISVLPGTYEIVCGDVPSFDGRHVRAGAWLLDPLQRRVVGRFAAGERLPRAVLIDPVARRVYAIGGALTADAAYARSLFVYDLDRFVLLDARPLSGMPPRSDPSATRTPLSRWADGSLALLLQDGSVVLIPPPA